MGAEGPDWIPSKNNGPYVIGFWRFIIKGWDHFFSHIVFGVCDGSSSFFGIVDGVMEFI